jgi:hypothetical protein
MRGEVLIRHPSDSYIENTLGHKNAITVILGTPQNTYYMPIRSQMVKMSSTVILHIFGDGEL